AVGHAPGREAVEGERIIVGLAERAAGQKGERSGRARRLRFAVSAAKRERGVERTVGGEEIGAADLRRKRADLDALVVLQRELDGVFEGDRNGVRDRSDGN